MPQISIIIPTINRYADLKNTIADLNKQSVTDFEIIIIDQTDIEIAETITGKNIVYLHKTFKSASKARNVGLLEAKSPIVLFLDDDVIIENIYFLKAHLDQPKKILFRNFQIK
ncbi:MAG: glycosyltransferase family 2 protein [Bacteroidetes bacterium]|nr:glycosyltransferase family 2 protein [Bacteroidota bacterium]